MTDGKTRGRWPGVLETAAAVFSWIGGILAVATLGVVLWVMDRFRAELGAAVEVTGDPARTASFEAAVAHDRGVTLLILALLVTVAALNFAAGMILLRKGNTARRGD